LFGARSIHSVVDRLRDNASVTVSLPGGSGYRVSDFSATVVALIETGAVLLPHDVNPDALPLRAAHVFLSFVHGGQLIGLKGELTFDSRGLRFQVQDGVQRRRNRYTRVDAELEVTLRRGDQERVRGVTVNVAPEGLLVNSDLPVELGERLEITLALPADATPLAMQAKVVRHAGGMIALHFQDIRRETGAAVAEFVVERRAALLQTA
jgi:hypothetical protein